MAANGSALLSPAAAPAEDPAGGGLFSPKSQMSANTQPVSPRRPAGLEQVPRTSLVGLGGSFDVPGSSPAKSTELKQAGVGRSGLKERAELKELFGSFDNDGNGHISSEELKQLLPGLGIHWVPDSVAISLVEQLDLDGDGQVSFKEFLLFYDTLIKMADIGAGGQGNQPFSPTGGQAPAAVDLLAVVKEQRRRLAKDQYMTDRQIATRARIYQLLYELPSVAPDFVYRRWWDVLILAVILYLWIVVSLQVVKGARPSLGFLMVDVVISAVLVFDVFIALNTAVQVSSRQSTLVVDRKAIFGLYLRNGGLFVDVASAVPLDLCIGLLSGNDTTWRVLRALRLLKMLKFGRLFKMTDRGTMDSSFVRFYFWTTALLRQGFVIFAVLHLLTLLRMMVNMAADDGDGEKKCHDFGQDRCTNGMAEYFYAFFWVWALLTTQGMAALEDELTYAYASVVMFMSLVLQGHVVANMSALVLKSNVEVQNQDAMRSTLAIMAHYEVPVRLQQEVLSFQYHSLQQNAAASLAHTLERLPDSMQREVGLYVKVELVAGVPMFHDISTEARLAVANCLEQTYAEPEDFIIKFGETGAEMFFMMHGFADVIIPVTLVTEDGVEQEQITEGRIVATIKRGDFFGEVALLQPDQTRTASIQALTYCDLFCLHANDFVELYDQFDELSVRVQGEARARGLVDDSTHCGNSSARPGIPSSSSIFGRLPLGMRSQLIHSTSKRTLISNEPVSAPHTPRSRSQRGSRARRSTVASGTTEPVHEDGEKPSPVSRPERTKDVRSVSLPSAIAAVSVVESSQDVTSLPATPIPECAAPSKEASQPAKPKRTFVAMEITPEIKQSLDVLERRMCIRLQRQEELARRSLRDEARGLGIRFDDLDRQLRDAFTVLEKSFRKDDSFGVGGLFGAPRRQSGPPRWHAM